jgi:dimethylhistidine N-methyltransferase
VAPPHASRPLIALVFEGLSESHKQLPSVLLYDARGSQLFEEICGQPEYYLSRAETRLLGAHGAAIAECCGPHAALIEYGAGSGRKTQLLLESLQEPHSYLPIDVDAVQLEAACRAMRRRFPTLAVRPLVQDFRQFVSLPPIVQRASHRVAFFAGSTIGNFRPLEAVALLNSIRESMGPQGGLLIGVDLVKDPAVIERAYNDAAGVTAAFNLNLLQRLNRELDATFDLAGFRHRAAWNDEHQRIEMSLVSTRAQVPSVAGISVALDAGEEILTEYCHKYSPEGFAALAQVAGWSVQRTWIDEESRYSLQFLEAIE